jgi:deoxyribose-phosphate aldolase
LPEAYSYSDIAKMIDDSLLNPTLTVEELEAGCKLARDYGVASVCILPYYAARCAEAAGIDGTAEHHDRV